MEETHELTAARLLSLPRRELQARAKAASVPANLKSRAIVEAIVAQRKTSNPAAAAWHSSTKDVTPAKDATHGRSQAGSPHLTLDARQGSASLLSLPADMQPLHQLVKSSRDQGLASPVPRLLPRQQLPGAFMSPAGTDPSSSPPSLLQVRASPLGKLAFSPLPGGAMAAAGGSPAGGFPARPTWGSGRAGASTLAQLRHSAEDDDDVVQCVDQSLHIAVTAAAGPARGAAQPAQAPPPAAPESYFDVSALHSPVPHPGAMAPPVSRWKVAPLHTQGPYQEVQSWHRPEGSTQHAPAAAAAAAASLSQSLQDLKLFAPLPLLHPRAKAAVAASIKLPALAGTAAAAPHSHPDASTSPSPLPSLPGPLVSPRQPAAASQLPARFSDQAAAPSVHRQLQPPGAVQIGLKPASSPVLQRPAVVRPRFETTSPQPASPLGPLLGRPSSRQGYPSGNPAAVHVPGSRTGCGAEAGFGGGKQGTGAARQRAAFGMPFQSVDVAGGARAGSSSQRLAATLTPPRLLGRAASALPALRDVTPRRVEETKRTTASGLASSAWLQPGAHGGSRPAAASASAAAAGNGASGARLPAIAASGRSAAAAPAAKAEGGGGGRRLSPIEPQAHPGPGHNKAALASRAVPLLSPLRTPARRVTAPEEPGGDVAAAADSRDAFMYDQLVARELLLPPATASAGMSTVTGLSSIKQHLLSLILPALAASHAPAAPPAAAGGRARAAPAAAAAAAVATPGEVAWFKPILLFGPSGVGKTTLARALAAEVSASAAGGRPAGGHSFHTSSSSGGTIYVDLGEVLARHMGQADKVIQAVFRAVRGRSGPMTLVLDKLEAIQSLQRQGDLGKAEAAARLRTALLVSFDEELYCSGHAAVRSSAAAVQPRPAAPPLVVVGVAGGGAVSIDDGLARCFTAARVYVPLPDIDTREALVFLKMASHEADLNVEDIVLLARRTEGFSGCEVQGLCDRAVQLSQRQHSQAGQRQRQPVEVAHFEAALSAARPALDHAAAVAYFKWKTHLVRLD